MKSSMLAPAVREVSVPICNPTQAPAQPQQQTDYAVVHVVDDNEQFRTGASLLLSHAGFWVRQYRSADHFMSVYDPAEIECLVLDLQMPGMNGLELQEHLRDRRVQIPIVIISAFANTLSVVQAVQNGAMDFLEKPVDDLLLIEKVNAALDRDRNQKRRDGDLGKRLAKLSVREREVMNLLLAAKTTVQIAHQLHISPKTVEKHRIHVFDKLAVGSVPEMMRLLLPVPAVAI